MAWVKNSTPPTDLEQGFRRVVRLAGAELSEQKASVQASAQASSNQKEPKAEMALAAQWGAQWLRAVWKANASDEEGSAFYADRFNEIIERRPEAPYWEKLSLQSDDTGITYPSVYPFRGEIDPSYDDPLRKPTDCRFECYAYIYSTPVYPNTSNRPSPGWGGRVIGGFFEDNWHATRILTYSVPVGQRHNTQRPIIIYVNMEIEATATIKGNTAWFIPITRMKVMWGPFWKGVAIPPPVNYKARWAGKETIPGAQVGGWIYETVRSVWRFGSPDNLGKQKGTGDIITLEVATMPSLGRYYAGNDEVTILHNESVEAWWPKTPGET